MTVQDSLFVFRVFFKENPMVSKKAVLYEYKTAQTVGFYCLLLPLRFFPLPSVTKDLVITYNFIR